MVIENGILIPKPVYDTQSWQPLFFAPYVETTLVRDMAYILPFRVLIIKDILVEDIIYHLS